MTDSLGVRLAYANVILVGHTFGAMTDTTGTFKIEIPPGRYTLKAMMMRYRDVQRTVEVGLEEEVTMNLVLSGRVALDGTMVNTTERALVEVRESSVSAAVSDEQLKSFPLGVYPGSTEPIRSGPLEICVCYDLSERGDSVHVTVTAAGKNVSGSPATVCGCFSFWKVEFGMGPEGLDHLPLGGSWRYPGAILEVGRRECNSPTLDCDPVLLGPGQSHTRELSFAFRPRDFEEWPGEVQVSCIYFHGLQGNSWVDAERVLLPPLAVPIRPIGMPYTPR